MLYKMIRPSNMKALRLVGAAVIGAASAAGIAQVPATRMMNSSPDAGTFWCNSHLFDGPLLGAATESYQEEMDRTGTTELGELALGAAFGRLRIKIAQGSDKLVHEVGVMMAQLVKSQSNTDVVSTLFNHDELLCAAVPPSPATHPHTRSLHTLHLCPPPTRTPHSLTGDIGHRISINMCREAETEAHGYVTRAGASSSGTSRATS